MEIVAIVGIWYFPCYTLVWQNLEAELREYYPDASIKVESCWYSFWQRRRMQEFRDGILQTYDKEGQELVLIGWSMGGVIATAIASRFTKRRVRLVVSIFGPHTYLWSWFSKWLGSPKRLLMPVLTFQARPFDFFVPYGSRFPGARSHTKLWCTHIAGLVFSRKPAKRIVQEMLPYLPRRF